MLESVYSFFLYVKSRTKCDDDDENSLWRRKEKKKFVKCLVQIPFESMRWHRRDMERDKVRNGERSEQLLLRDIFSSGNGYYCYC